MSPEKFCSDIKMCESTHGVLCQVWWQRSGVWCPGRRRYGELGPQKCLPYSPSTCSELPANSNKQVKTQQTKLNFHISTQCIQTIQYTDTYLWQKILITVQTKKYIYLFTCLLFNFQQVNLETLFHLTGLLLSCCLLRTQSGDLQEGEGEERRRVYRKWRNIITLYITT